MQDVARSHTFFEGFGFDFNFGFSLSENRCVEIAEDQFVMLLDRPRIADFVRGEVADSEHALSCTYPCRWGLGRCSQLLFVRTSEALFAKAVANIMTSEERRMT